LAAQSGTLRRLRIRAAENTNLPTATGAFMKPTIKIAIVAIFAATLIGWSLTTAAQEIGTAGAQGHAANRAEPSSRAMALTKVTTAFALGEPIGDLAAGEKCDSREPREWSELLQRRVEADLPAVFRAQMAAARLLPVDRESAGRWEVSAFVNDVDLHLCNVGKGAWRGSLRVQVSWQVIARDSGRVVYQASSDGRYVRDDAHAQRPASSAIEGLREALAAAARNLASDQRFLAALQSPVERDRMLAYDTRD
jgi:hypothetical protein